MNSWIWSLVGAYLAGVVVFLFCFRDKVLGGWFQAFVTALCWPILAVAVVPGHLARFLIPEWRIAWRFASVRAAALLALLSILQAELLPLIQFAIPDKVWPYVTAGFGIAILVVRLIAQPGLLKDKAAP